jgi:hypothetical protein
MQQGHVQFYFMCKLYVDPKGMCSYYTVCSPISISIERLFLLVWRDAVKPGSPCQSACKGLLKVYLLVEKKIIHPCFLHLPSFLLATENWSVNSAEHHRVKWVSPFTPGECAHIGFLFNRC